MPNCYNCPKFAEVERLRVRIAALESGEEMQALKKRLEEAEAIGNTDGRRKDASTPPSTTQLLLKIDRLQRNLEETRRREEEQKERAEKDERIIHGLQKELKQEKEKQEKQERESEARLLKSLELQKERLDRKYTKVTEALRAEIEKKEKEISDLKHVVHPEPEAEPAVRVAANSRNSSTPPSQDPSHKTIVSNNRLQSGKPAGGQIGHAHHPRCWYTPDNIISVAPPEEVLANAGDYYPIGEPIRKQRIGMELSLKVTEYQAQEYRHRGTLRRVHGAFPEDLGHLESNYDPTLEAVVSWLHSVGNMSYCKIGELLSEMSKGQLKMSEGCMVNLEKRFAAATVDERAKIQKNMLRDPVMNIDGTFTRVNGKLHNVLILRSRHGVSYFSTGCKGKKAVEQTFAGQYHGNVVSDGETTFHGLGDRLQRCLVHVSRYLIGAMENEPWLTFPGKMHDFLQKIMERRNQDVKKGLQKMEAQEYEKICRKYDRLTDLGRREYTEHPPRDDFRKGYTTWKDLAEHRDQFLLFLTDYRIPPHNNDAEKSARELKVHSKINGGLRSEKAVDAHSKTMTVLGTYRILNPFGSLTVPLISGLKKAKQIFHKKKRT